MKTWILPLVSAFAGCAGLRFSDWIGGGGNFSSALGWLVLSIGLFIVTRLN